MNPRRSWWKTTTKIEPKETQVSYYSAYSDSLLLTDLAPDVNTGPKVDWLEKVSHGTNAATVAYSLGILSDNIARAEIYDDAWRRKKQNIKKHQQQTT